MSVARFGVGAHEQKNEPAGGAGKYDRHWSFLLEFGCLGREADPFRYIRSAILKTSQPKPAKLNPQRTMTAIIASIPFSQDDYDLTVRKQVTNC